MLRHSARSLDMDEVSVNVHLFYDCEARAVLFFLNP